jgi:hypothetical protein
MGKDKAPEHEFFDVLTKRTAGDNTVKCNLCAHTFTGGPARMRAHILCISGKGVDACANFENTPQDVLDKLW